VFVELDQPVEFPDISAKNSDRINGPINAMNDLRDDVNVGLEIPNFVGIILPTPFKSFVNSLSNIRKPLFYRFVFIHP